MVPREPMEFRCLFVQLVVFLDVVFREIDELYKVRVGRFIPHIEITHYEIVVECGIRLKPILRSLQTDSF